MVNWLRKLFDKLQAHFDGDILLQNLRHAFRTQRPGTGFFACVVVVILAPGTSAAQLRRVTKS
jgi:hypothetical protein